MLDIVDPQVADTIQYVQTTCQERCLKILSTNDLKKDQCHSGPNTSSRNQGKTANCLTEGKLILVLSVLSVMA